MGLMPLSPAAWTARLRCAWQHSLVKGYHDRRTNWDRCVGFELAAGWWGKAGRRGCRQVARIGSSVCGCLAACLLGWLHARLLAWLIFSAIPPLP